MSKVKIAILEILLQPQMVEKAVDLSTQNLWLSVRKHLNLLKAKSQQIFNNESQLAVYKFHQHSFNAPGESSE